MASRIAIQRFSKPRPETIPRTAPCVTNACSEGEEENSGLLSQAGGYHGAQQTSNPRYIRTMTRRNRSVCCSQYGMRCGALPPGSACIGNGGGGGVEAGIVGIAFESWITAPGGSLPALGFAAGEASSVGLGKLSSGIPHWTPLVRCPYLNGTIAAAWRSRGAADLHGCAWPLAW